VSRRFSKNTGNTETRTWTGMGGFLRGGDRLPDARGNGDGFRDVFLPGQARPDQLPGAEQDHECGRILAGVEAYATWWFHPSVGTVLSYTIRTPGTSITRGRSSGSPSQRGSVSLVAAPVSGFEGQLSWRVESEQLDFGPTDWSPGKRPGFGVVDLYARQTFPKPAPEWKEVVLFGKVRTS